MKIPALIITALSFYSLLGVCPMQMSMMNPATGHNMAMMEASSMAMDSMNIETIAGMNSCATCVRSVDHFSLKDTSIVLDTTEIAVIPVNSRVPTNTIAYREYIPMTSTGPPILASDIVQFVVVRT